MPRDTTLQNVPTYKTFILIYSEGFVVEVTLSDPYKKQHSTYSIYKHMGLRDNTMD